VDHPKMANILRTTEMKLTWNYPLHAVDAVLGTTTVGVFINNMAPWGWVLATTGI
jgi:hypothetical protein